MPIYTTILEVDDSTRGDHHYLDSDDRCIYMGEYEPGGGYGVSATNQLIFNFKKSPAAKNNPSEYQHKIAAIRNIAACLTGLIGKYNDFLFVPVPPSKAAGHPEYDDRLVKVFEQCHATNPDFRFANAVTQAESFDAEHLGSDKRPTPDERLERYNIDVDLIRETRIEGSAFIIFDDVLNTGSHFKAVQAMLRKHFPKDPIYGFFVARVTRPNVEPLFFDL